MLRAVELRFSRYFVAGFCFDVVAAGGGARFGWHGEMRERGVRRLVGGLGEVGEVGYSRPWHRLILGGMYLVSTYGRWAGVVRIMHPQISQHTNYG